MLIVIHDNNSSSDFDKVIAVRARDVRQYVSLQRNPNKINQQFAPINVNRRHISHQKSIYRFWDEDQNDLLIAFFPSRIDGQSANVCGKCGCILPCEWSFLVSVIDNYLVGYCC